MNFRWLCSFGLHSYSNWKTIGSGKLFGRWGSEISPQPYAIYREQERTCRRCNKLQLRTVET